jgi:chaperonin cofactor prefoldin
MRTMRWLMAAAMLLVACTAQSADDEGPAPGRPQASDVRALAAAVTAIEGSVGADLAASSAALQDAVDDEPAELPTAVGDVLIAVRRTREAYEDLELSEPEDDLRRVSDALRDQEAALATLLDSIQRGILDLAHLAAAAEAAADASTARALLAARLARDG